MSDDCPDPPLQELFEVSQDHRHQDQGVKSFRIVVDPSQTVEPLFLPDGFEMSALRLSIGYGGMEAQDEIPGAMVIPQRIHHCAIEWAPTSEIALLRAPDPQNHAAELHPSGATSKQTVQYRLANMGRNELRVAAA